MKRGVRTTTRRAKQTMRTKRAKQTKQTMRSKQKGGSQNDVCGICPVCDSADTHRYATSPAGNIVFCECAAGHIYSPTEISIDDV